MRFFRYRRPSFKTILGITKAKKRIKKDLGITALNRTSRFEHGRTPSAGIKRKIGYESDAGRLVRDGLPSPGGCLSLIVVVGICVGWAMIG